MSNVSVSPVRAAMRPVLRSTTPIGFIRTSTRRRERTNGVPEVRTWLSGLGAQGRVAPARDERSWSAFDVLLGNRAAGGQVEPPIVDRAAPGRWPLVLDEEHEPAGLGDEGRLEMRIGVIEHRPGAVRRLADREGAFEDVPDLREIVLVERMMRAGVVADQAGVGLGRRLRTRVEEHLAPLAGPAQCLPFALIDVDGGERLVRRCLDHVSIPPLGGGV